MTPQNRSQEGQVLPPPGTPEAHIGMPGFKFTLLIMCHMGHVMAQYLVPTAHMVTQMEFLAFGFILV